MGIEVPRDLDSAVAAVATADSLARMYGWTKAAHIVAWVDIEQSGTDGRVTPHEFARRLRECGLRGWSKDTVVRHVMAWRKASDDGFLPDRPEPGDVLDPPQADWADYYPSTVVHDSRYRSITDATELVEQATKDGTGPAKVLDIAKNTKAMAAAIKGSPAVADAAREALRLAQVLSPVQPPGSGARKFGLDDVLIHLRAALAEVVAAQVARNTSLEETGEGDAALLLTRIRAACDAFENGDQFSAGDRAYLENMGVVL